MTRRARRLKQDALLYAQTLQPPSLCEAAGIDCSQRLSTSGRRRRPGVSPGPPGSAPGSGGQRRCGASSAPFRGGQLSPVVAEAAHVASAFWRNPSTAVVSCGTELLGIGRRCGGEQPCVSGTAASPGRLGTMFIEELISSQRLGLGARSPDRHAASRPVRLREPRSHVSAFARYSQPSLPRRSAAVDAHRGAAACVSVPEEQLQSAAEVSSGVRPSTGVFSGQCPAELDRASASAPGRRRPHRKERTAAVPRKPNSRAAVTSFAAMRLTRCARNFGTSGLRSRWQAGPPLNRQAERQESPRSPSRSLRSEGVRPAQCFSDTARLSSTECSAAPDSDQFMPMIGAVNG